MKKVFLFLFTLIYLLAHSQPEFAKADTIVASFSESYTDVADLSQKLTTSLETEREKARAIFMWIAHNVRYSCSKYHNPSRPSINARTEEEYLEKLAAWQEKAAQKTVKSKRGICGDYSRLFKAMCDEVGLEAVIISGDARDFHKPYRNAHDNPHAWNAVKIDDQWHLLDATWAAGYTDAGVTKFTRRPAPGYFMTAPEWFVQSHFPDDEKWQLLDPPLDEKAFADQPLINYGQMKYPIEDFSLKMEPASEKKGILQIRFKFTEAPAVFMLSTGKSKPIKFTQVVEKGWHVFQFSPKGVKDLVLFGGKSRRSRLGWLARYDVP